MSRIVLIATLALLLAEAGISHAEVFTVRPSGDEDYRFFAWAPECNIDVSPSDRTSPTAPIDYTGFDCVSGEPPRFRGAVLAFPLPAISDNGLKAAGAKLHLRGSAPRFRHIDGDIGRPEDGIDLCAQPVSGALSKQIADGWSVYDVTRHVAGDIANGRQYSVFVADSEEEQQSGIISLSEDPNGNGPYMTLETAPDTTPPPLAVIDDGGRSTDNPSRLRAELDTFDVESGITDVAYALGTQPGDPGSGYLVDWEMVDYTVALEVDGLNLQPDVRYYWYVRVRNGAGMWSDVSVSDGIRYDVTPPTTPIVSDGGPQAGVTLEIYAAWSCDDPESDIVDYEYAVGTSPEDPGEGYLRDWSSADTATQTTISNLLIPRGQTCHVYVRARNSLGMYSAVGVSRGISDPYDISFEARPTGEQDAYIYIDFQGLRDVLSAINYAEIADWDYCQRWGNSYHRALIHIPLPQPKPAYTRAVLGLNGTFYKGLDISHVDAAVSGPVEASEMDAPKTRIVRLPADMKPLAFVDVTDLVNEDYAAGRPFSAYRADPGEGHGTLRLSESGEEKAPVLLFLGPPTEPDLTPPSVPVVVDDSDSTNSLTSLHAQWSAFDPESPLSLYEYRIGTIPGELTRGEVVPWTSAGLATEVTLDDLSLTNAMTYYFFVRARNTEGLWSAVGQSDGIRVERNVLYRNDFANGAGPEWSLPRTETTPGTGWHPPDKFLGQFGYSAVGLRLEQIPPHNNISVSLDLYVIRSWDGNQFMQGETAVGPDMWRMVLAGGSPVAPLFTFSNANFSPSFTYSQSFPEGYPAENPPFTGASERNTLGYLVDFGALYKGPLDAVYRVYGSWEHTAPTIALYLQAWNLQDIADESWGIDNIVITTDSPLEPPAPTEVRDEGAFTTSRSALSAMWTAPSPDVVEYRYAVSAVPEDTGTYIAGWTSAGNATSTTAQGLSLQVGEKYYILVQARRQVGEFSAAGVSDGIMVVEKIATSPGEAKLSPDGTLLALTHGIITASEGLPDGRAYVEAPDRSAGIALQGVLQVPEGTQADMAGTLATIGGERILQVREFMVHQHLPELQPVRLSLLNACSRPFFFNPATGAGQRGITSPPPFGLSTIGLLVRVSGMVLDMDSNYLYLNDGSWPGSTGIRISRQHMPPEVGLLSCLTVTGISSMRQTGPVYQMQILPRRAEDVQIEDWEAGDAWLQEWWPEH